MLLDWKSCAKTSIAFLNFLIKTQYWIQGYRTIQAWIFVSIAFWDLPEPLSIINIKKNTRNRWLGFKLYHKFFQIAYHYLGIFLHFFLWIVICHDVSVLTHMLNWIFVPYLCFHHCQEARVYRFQIWGFSPKEQLGCKTVTIAFSMFFWIKHMPREQFMMPRKLFAIFSNPP